MKNDNDPCKSVSPESARVFQRYCNGWFDYWSDIAVAAHLYDDFRRHPRTSSADRQSRVAQQNVTITLAKQPQTSPCEYSRDSMSGCQCCRGCLQSRRAKNNRKEGGQISFSGLRSGNKDTEVPARWSSACDVDQVACPGHPVLLVLLCCESSQRKKAPC